MLFDIIYDISTGFVLAGFLFSLRFYSYFKFAGTATIGFMLITALLWGHIPSEYSNAMYDVSFLVVVICIIRSKLQIHKQEKICKYLATGECQADANKTTNKS